MVKFHDHYDVSLLIQVIIPEVQQPWYGWVQEKSGTEVFWRIFPNIPNWISQLVFPCIRSVAPLNGGMVGLTKWETKARSWVYLVHSLFHSGSVALVLNIRTGHIFSHYHVVFDGEFSTMYHMIKWTVPVNWYTCWRGTHNLTCRKISLLKNSVILINPQACPYLGWLDKSTHRSLVTNTYIQGLINRLNQG